MELLDEDEMDNTTFCMWCTNGTDIWIQNETEGNDGGKEYLLGYICQNAEDWCEWASNYYEVEVEMDIVQKVYDGGQLLEEEVKKLNPKCDAQEVLKEMDKLVGK